MTLTIEEAQARFPELVRGLAAGEEVVITEDERTVARLVAPPAAVPVGGQRPGPGLLKGMITHMAPDFDEPLDDLREYME